jgi:hypothetical protein
MLQQLIMHLFLSFLACYFLDSSLWRYCLFIASLDMFRYCMFALVGGIEFYLRVRNYRSSTVDEIVSKNDIRACMYMYSLSVRGIPSESSHFMTQYHTTPDISRAFGKTIFDSLSVNFPKWVHFYHDVDHFCHTSRENHGFTVTWISTSGPYSQSPCNFAIVWLCIHPIIHCLSGKRFAWLQSC